MNNDFFDDDVIIDLGVSEDQIIIDFLGYDLEACESLIRIYQG